nr:reverse transcriptase domain-containing protein [Tanacetum cinerariifolium]
MSDSEDSTITYTTVSSPFGGLSDIGSPGVDGPPVMLEDPYAYVVVTFQAPPSPDYVSGPEYPPSHVYVPEFIQEPVYPEFMLAEDDILPTEEEPLLIAASPTTESPGYIDEAERWEILEADMSLQKRLCTAHIGTYELGESSAVATARLREPVKDDLYSKPQISDYTRDTAGGDQEVAGNRPQAIGTDCTEVMLDSADCSSMTHLDLRGRQSPSTARASRLYRYFVLFSYHKMAPKRTTRANPTTTTTTTARFKALAARDADKNMNHDDSHVSGTGVVELTQWFEKMETVFRISNCSVENQIKFSTCTLLGSAVTWWNSYVITVGPDVAYAMTWVDLKKKMTDKYWPRGEMKKLESELWNLRVKSNDVVSYNQHFQELALLCVRMFLEESDKIERYVGETIKANSNNRTRGRIPTGLTLQDMVKRNLMEDRSLYSLSATITTMVHVLRNATSVTKLAT